MQQQDLFSMPSYIGRARRTDAGGTVITRPTPTGGEATVWGACST